MKKKGKTIVRFIYMLILGIMLGILSNTLEWGSRYQAPALSETEIDDFSTPIDDITMLLNNELTGIIYFGRETCPFCLHFNKALKKEMEQNPELVIYKLDTDKWRESSSFEDVLSKYNVNSIPNLVKVDEHGAYSIFLTSDYNEKTQADLHDFIVK